MARPASARTRRYIESAAGVGDGGRTGLTAIVVGLLFLAAIFLAPIVQIIPLVATAPALVLVGYLMFTQVGEIDVRDIYIGLPALLIMILMPLTFTITIGIGAGLVVWVFLKVVGRQSARRPLADVDRLPRVPRLLRPGAHPAVPLAPALKPMTPGRAIRPGVVLLCRRCTD